MDNPLSYVASVYEAFHDEPEKLDEFFKLAEDATANRFDEASAIAMTELMKGHQNLVQGLSVFFPNANMTSPREAAQERFESVNSHVYNSVVRILKKYENGKMLEKEMRKEVLDLVYYHEDLTGEFCRMFPPKP
ncbi:hypothetical protein EUTSA_v10009749mg [Eutrema salsugineum]|uniref:Uncharacterized protein n=1 Tax=Eutrema salsugineum TaxID=72664 RepID=V4KXF7_EUTSA|nr:hypothetical protein EUTSA_v10009749mg [Eutrema salsugineum]